eukprot:1956041-Alexandrium_andersonii.AAC.1
MCIRDRQRVAPPLSGCPFAQCQQRARPHFPGVPAAVDRAAPPPGIGQDRRAGREVSRKRFGHGFRSRQLQRRTLRARAELLRERVARQAQHPHPA